MQPQVDVQLGEILSIDGSVRAAVSEHRATIDRVLDQLERSSGSLAQAAGLLVRTLRGGNKVLVAGNGGSAAEAQHFAAELVGRFLRDRSPYAAIALTTDTSILTAVANDYGYEHVFARQVFAWGQQDDLLVAFSTSGESENLVRAAVAARQLRMKVVALTGQRGGRLGRLADVAVQVPCDDTPTTQEIHTMATHILCGITERELSGEEDGL